MDKTTIKLDIIKEALDTLAIALVDCEHIWTDKERRLYRSAIDFIKHWESLT